MAFAIECIEAFKEAHRLESPSLDLSVNAMRVYCSAEDLGWWEASAFDQAWTVLEHRSVAAETGFEELQDAVEWALDDVGRGNLYAGVVGQSEATLKAALKVAEALLPRKAALALAHRFAQYAFDPADAWGDPIDTNQ